MVIHIHILVYPDIHQSIGNRVLRYHRVLHGPADFLDVRGYRPDRNP